MCCFAYVAEDFTFKLSYTDRHQVLEDFASNSPHKQLFIFENFGFAESRETKKILDDDDYAVATTTFFLIV